VTLRGTGFHCFIIPPDVLRKLADDAEIPAQSRQAMRETAAHLPVWRTLRDAYCEALRTSLVAKEIPSLRLASVLAPVPSVTVYDSKNTTSLPGVPISTPGKSSDGTARDAFDETTAVARFYQQCFGRNSVDGAGMTLMSSIHYGVQYSNAFWNGMQMVYGDGDGRIFLDFTKSTDVIAHELTHGVTQFTAGLAYADEPGALNESISDAFGSMFRQWRKNQTAAQADWLIGAEIIGPAARAKGYTCLRDLAQPDAKHCLSRQPSQYRDFIPGGDPHDNSGIPNHAFYLAATNIGGHSWEKAGKVWYAALTSNKTKPNMRIAEFAKLTRASAKSLFATDTAVYRGVDDAWASVGFPSA
jgi:Zn-dependent metalloprotease